jgi:phosphatidylglycerophosphate synthase
MHVASPWSTRANALTLARLLIAPALAAALLAHAPGRAAVLFFMAVATDLADGWVARRYGESRRSAASSITPSTRRSS